MKLQPYDALLVYYYYFYIIIIIIIITVVIIIRNFFIRHTRECHKPSKMVYQVHSKL